MANGFLLNTVPGGTVISSTAEFDVRNYAVRLVGAGLTGGDVVQVQVLAGLNATTGTWADLMYDGKPIQLSTVTNSQVVLIVEGHYRVTYSGGSTTLQVWMEEDSIGLDQKSIAAFPTMTNVGPAGPTGAKGNTGAAGVVQSVVAGTGITVDATDPANPIISLTP